MASTGGSGHRERLRKRFLQGGGRALLDYEKLELLLAYAIPRRDTKALARDLIDRFGSLESVLSQPPDMLSGVDGIGPAASVLISLVSQLARHAATTATSDATPVLDSLDSVRDFLSGSFSFQRRERLVALLLDSRNRLLAEKTIDSGTVDRSSVHPRNLVEMVIRTGATAVILVHNHPGGRLEASREDIALTRRLGELGGSLGFRVLDHIIVSPDGMLSMRSEGLLP